MKAMALLLACALLAGCATLSTSPSEGSTGTRYRLGDYVVYRYGGSFTQEPVLLTERVVGRTGNRLTIEVEAKRGAESRRWQQVVTDTPENQRANVVDELYDLSDGQRARLPNENNRDLMRLYDWTYIVPDGPSSSTTDLAELTFAGATWSCRVEKGRTSWKGRPLRFQGSSCPAFLWTNGPGGFQDEQTGEEILTVEILEAGHREPAPQAEEAGFPGR